jgi:hypothetical protein
MAARPWAWLDSTGLSCLILMVQMRAGIEDVMGEVMVVEWDCGALVEI